MRVCIVHAQYTYTIHAGVVVGVAMLGGGGTPGHTSGRHLALLPLLRVRSGVCMALLSVHAPEGGGLCAAVWGVVCAWCSGPLWQGRGALH